MFHDKETVKMGKILNEWTEEQWKAVYEEVRPIYLSRSSELKGDERLSLSTNETPPSLRDLGFDQVFATSEGILWVKIGGGWTFNGAWVHCIYSPNLGTRRNNEVRYPPEEGMHDRRGIWFHGFQQERWAYEVAD